MSHRHQHQPQTDLQRRYPRWITDRSGIRRVVPDPQQHGALMLTEYSDDATEKYPPPPTLRDLLDTGMAPEEALATVAEEERKAMAHEPPYCVAPPPPVPPSLEEVIAAGYSPSSAPWIVEEEQRKQAAGMPPYGANPFEPAAAPAPVQPEAPEPIHEVEPTILAYKTAIENGEQMADTVSATEPVAELMQMFQTDAAATPKRRGRKAPGE